MSIEKILDYLSGPVDPESWPKGDVDSRPIERRRTIMSIEKILDYLNAARVRCTYKAVGEALGGVPAQCVAPCFLGERRKKASWVVKAETGQPTGYTSDQKHPQLEERECIIRSGAELEKCMCEQRWVSKA